MSAFALLVGINTSIACYPVGLKNWEINAGVKNFNSIMKQKKHDEILLFAKTLSNTIEDLNSKALIDSNISHDELFLVNDVLKEYNDVKEAIKNLHNR